MSRTTRGSSGAGQVIRTPIKRLIFAQVRRLGIMMLSASALLCAIDLAGFVDHGNGHLRYLYYQMRGSQALAERVVLVAMDEGTGEAWGPPPWSWQRYEQLLATVLAAEPRAVGVLEPGPRVLPPEEPRAVPALEQALASGRLILPPIAAGLGQPRLDMAHVQHGIEAVSLAGAGDQASVTARLARAAGLPVPASDRLWVHYVGGPDSLPTLQAHRVASGEIPADTFRGRIVVIGLRGEAFAPLVPTPIGPMSPAEVHAYAMRGLAHEAVWHVAPLWLRVLLQALLALACLLLLPRLRTRRAVLLLAGLALAALAADYALFATGTLLLGASGPVAAIGVAAALSWLAERSRAHQEIMALSRWTAKQLAFASSASNPGAADGDDVWDRFASAAGAYLRFESTLLGELPEGLWHIRFERSLGESADQIAEPRRDIRREPYKSAYVSHRPVWSESFMHADLQQRSLLVPLTSFKRILGLWVVNFPRDTRVERSTLRLIEMLAEQISSTMERQRIRKIFSVHSARREGLLVQPIQEMRSTFQAFSQEQSKLAKLFDSMPVGVLVATLWGHIEYANEPMRRFLGTLEADDVQQRDLPGLITLLTDASAANVQDTVMDLVGGRTSITLSCSAAVDSAYQVTLSPLSQAALFEGTEGTADDMGVLSHFVLTVTRQASEEDQRISQSAHARG